MAGEAPDLLSFDDAPRDRELQHPPWFKLSFLDLREDLGDAIAGGKRGLMVYFEQENCGYCKALLEINLAQPEIARYARTHFDVVAIDIWGDREVTDMAGRTLSERQYAVRERTNFTPSIIFYDASGIEVFRLRGYYPPYTFRAALEFIADRHHERESFRDYLARADPPAKFDRADLNNEAFFAPPPYALDRSRLPADRPLAVFFEQRDCHSCDVLHSEPLADEETRRLLSAMEVVQLDMWSDTPVVAPDGVSRTAAQWAAELDVFFAPTIVFFDETGVERIRIDSVVRMYRLARVLEYVIEHGYADGLTYQQWHGRRPALP